MMQKQTSLTLAAAVLLVVCCGWKSHGKDVNTEMCQSYVNMFCTRCHSSERICTALKKNTPEEWDKTIKLMAEYDDMDQDIQETVFSCMTTLKPGSPIICKDK
ncbi:MAG: hypothetical protein GQ559_04640 [Desulfobulbaceae bacterium]|nr:hypothetical protein [Desulfobulbaceae bacterium]